MTMTFLLLAAMAATQPLPAPNCPIDRAVYRLRGGPEFTAGFARQDRRKSLGSNLALWLRTPEHLYWFSLGSPNGYGGTYLRPDLDPRRSIRLDDDQEREAAEGIERADMPGIPFDVFNADLSAPDGPPQADQPAPALL